jgi:hypothetical protein
VQAVLPLHWHVLLFSTDRFLDNGNEEKVSSRGAKIMTQWHSRSGPIEATLPSLHPGEVITGDIFNGIEDRHATGKTRLVVVVDASNPGAILVIGLTSKGVTKLGEKREELVDNHPWGWRGRTFVFGRRLSRLSRIDVGRHVGWLSAKDGATLANVFNLGEDWASDFGEAA